MSWEDGSLRKSEVCPPFREVSEKDAGNMGQGTIEEKKVVSRLGFDPSTLALKGRCSTE